MNATAMPAYEWKNLPWRTIERRVFKLQTRIYRASGRGDVKTVHRLQRLLVQSWSAKCLAVRRVTQDNQGKQTAGVDGVKSLTPFQRLRLVRDLALTQKPRPVRRVWIPKPHTADQRPLGIPVLHDRAAQALVKLALEPEWEARFEPNSYGFRPGRSCHDAVQAIFQSICRKAKYVLDADIRKCFDCIDHTALLAKLGTFPALRQVIGGWLKAGVLNGGDWFPTEAGTPQGGVLSPLLANIALHGLETSIVQRFSKPKPTVIRYADDFVILHPERAVIEAAQQAVADWLRRMGLDLQPEKTRLVHTLQQDGAHRPGFDFLGFTVRQFPRGKQRCGRDSQGRPLGFKTHIRPSKAASKEHQRKLKTMVKQRRASSQLALIADLNPVIRGWSRYYATVVSKDEFARQDHLLFVKLRRWAGHRHHRRNRWRQYWRQGWEFQAQQGNTTISLLLHRRTPIRRHVKVQGARSPYDGDWVYWSARLGKHPETAPQTARLLKRQQGKCAWCGLTFRMEDHIESDHIVPRHQGGGHGDANRQLLHRHCHDTKSLHDKDQTAEEPDAGKLARPVLKTGGPGDRLA